MGHYEERLQADLDRIRGNIGELGRRVVSAVREAVHGLLNLDRVKASETILGDKRVNRMVRRSDRLCHAFVARHLPSAGILRTISAVLRLNVALERIGDYAVTIARETVQLNESPPATISGDIETMTDQSCSMLEQAIDAFMEGDAERARGTRAMAGQVDSTFDRVFADLTREGEAQSRPVQDLFGLLIVFNRIERVSDQAKNICEETIFAATGETTVPKRLRVLFVDRSNARWSLLAEALAKKAFPENSDWDSAGWRPSDAADPALAPYFEEKGLDPSVLVPSTLPTDDDLDGYHLIIGVGSRPRDHLNHIPFRTVLLAWDVVPQGQGDTATPESLDQASKELSVLLHELMETLYGEDVG